jgi:hypothetical protein
VIEEVVTLPLRIGLRLAGFVLRRVGLLGEDEAPPRRQPERPPVRPREPVRWDERPSARRRERAAARPPEPAHVEQELEVVAEVADPGAEEGPGPQISVAEPWDGYSRMRASDVIDRLAAATPEELAVVQLYEGAHKRRKTVLEAAAYSQRK